MDNIKDRQFYWEVKQFFNGKPENNVPPQPKPSLKDAVSGVLKENNPYKQTNFSTNPTSVNIAQNAIQGLGAMDAANKPSCVAYTKNAIKNPFNLNEGFWDTVSGILAPGGTQIAKAVNTAKNVKNAVETKANSDATEQRLNAEDARKKEIYQAANDRDKAFDGRWDAVKSVANTITSISNLANSGQLGIAANRNYYKDPLTGALAFNLGNPNQTGGLIGLANSMKQQNASLNPVASAQTTKPPVAPSPTPVQTETPKPASAPAPVQGQSQAPNAQTKAPVQGQSQTPPVQNQTQPTPTQNQTQPQSTPAKNQPTTTTAPQSGVQRGPGGGVIADQSKFTYSASETPDVYKGMDDRRALGQVPMGGEVVGPNGIQKQNSTVSPFVQSLQNSIRQSFSQNNKFTPSGGQYRNRGNSNMGMATRPNRPEAMTLQSAMAQQNRQATRNALGQMGAVEGANSSSGFRGSVLPPAGQLTSMGTQKENEFKFARGSRLA